MNERNLTRYVWERAVISKHGGPSSSTTRHVLLTLATHVDRELVAFPSIETLTGESGLSDRAVRMHLALAERGGWIQRSARREGGKAWANYVYRLTLPQVAAASSAGAIHEGAAADAAASSPEGPASLSEGAALHSEGAAPDSTLVRQEVPTNNTMNIPRTENSNALVALSDVEVAGSNRGNLAALLRQKGVQVTPGNPLLVEWVSAGITEHEALEAVARARLNDGKQEPNPIPARYLDPIIREVLQERGNPRRPVTLNGVRVGTAQPMSKTMQAIVTLQRMKAELRTGSAEMERFNIIGD